MRYREATRIEIFFWLFNLIYLCRYKLQQQHIITIPRRYIRIELNNANRVAESRLCQKQNINLFSFQFLSFRVSKNQSIIGSFNSENEIMAGGNILLFHQEYGQQFLVVSLSCIVDSLAIYISTNYFFHLSQKPFLVSFILSYDRL